MLNNRRAPAGIVSATPPNETETEVDLSRYHSITEAVPGVGTSRRRANLRSRTSSVFPGLRSFVPSARTAIQLKVAMTASGQTQSESNAVR